jgi:hypothetical protein
MEDCFKVLTSYQLVSGGRHSRYLYLVAVKSESGWAEDSIWYSNSVPTALADEHIKTGSSIKVDEYLVSQHRLGFRFQAPAHWLRRLEKKYGISVLDKVV